MDRQNDYYTKTIYVDNDIEIIYSESSKTSPTITITDSYRIKGIKNKREVIDTIKYLMNKRENLCFRWKRSDESLMTEFIIHNIGYSIFYPLSKIGLCKELKERAKNTDFTIEDEEIYDLKNPFKFTMNMLKILTGKL